MTILRDDIKIKKSERMTDTPDGGGQMTGNEVIDGQINNVFTDISRFDRTGGRVNLRKVYGHVDAQNQDVYLGAHAVLTDQPDDPNVSFTLFNTDSPFDERSDAQRRIESYVVQGPVSFFTLYEDHLVGQRTVLAFARPETARPDVGDVLALSVESGGDIQTIQFVRIIGVSTEVVTFPLQEGGEIQRQVITMEIGTPLQYGFEGADPTIRVPVSPTLIRTTTVADIARYYGVVPLSSSAAVLDRVLQLDTVYGQLIPASQSEQPIVDARAAPDSTVYAPCGAERTESPNEYLDEGETIYLTRSPVPGSMTIKNNTGEVWEDVDGVGVLVSGSSGFELLIDYDAARIDIGGSGSIRLWTVTYTPAAKVTQAADSFIEPVTQGTSRYVWTPVLSPIPAPGALVITYQALGKLYRVRDNGRGQLQPDIPNTGSGTLNYTTGSVSLTLGALPDVDSVIAYQWAAPQHVERIDDAGSPRHGAPKLRIETGEFIDPTSLSLSYTNAAGTFEITDDGSGALTGDGSGVVDYANGVIWLQPDNWIPDGQTIDVEFGNGPKQSEIVAAPPPDGSGNMVFTINGGSAIAPYSVALQATFKRSNDDTVDRIITDDGSGNLLDRGISMGEVDYSTGEVTLLPETGVSTYRYRTAVNRQEIPEYRTITADVGRNPPEDVFREPVSSTLKIGSRTIYSTSRVITTPLETYTLVVGDDITVTFQPSGQSYPATTQQIERPDYLIDIQEGFSSSVAANSILYRLNDRLYFDRDGLLYRNLDATTGAATECGAVNYATGIISIDSIPYDPDDAMPDSGELIAAAALHDPPWTEQAFLYAPGAPLAPASLVMTAVDTSGNQITAAADQSGYISGSDVTGYVDQQTGAIELQFGKNVDIAPDTGEPAWQATFVDPATIKINAVILVPLPLDAEILGLDPTRLPSDGRVPIYRVGDRVVILHEETETLPAPLSADQTVALSRAPVSAVRVQDSNSLDVDPALFTVDLEAGEITFADPLDLSAYQEPLRATHRIEDMRLVTDVQINGQITVDRGVAYAYPAGETKVASALYMGDLQARAFNVFTQKTWTGDWADDRIGDDSTAKYDDVNFPILVDNAAAVEERWSVIFTSATDFNVVGENLGVVATGDIYSHVAPTNPLTDEPYFTIRSDGWGVGGVNNNVLRFNTSAAAHPLWIARTILSGPDNFDTDSGTIELRGDAD